MRLLADIVNRDGIKKEGGYRINCNPLEFDGQWGLEPNQRPTAHKASGGSITTGIQQIKKPLDSEALCNAIFFLRFGPEALSDL